MIYSYFFFGVGSLFFGFSAKGQSTEQKQWLQTIEQLRGANKKAELFTALFDLGESCLVSNTDTALLLATETFQLANTMHNDTCIAWANMLLGDCYLEPYDFETALDYYYLALPVFEKYKHEQGLCETINGLGFAYMCLLQADSAHHYIAKHLQLAKKLNNSKQIGEAYYYWGNVLLSTLGSDSALIKFKEAQKWFEQANDLTNLADIHYSIAEAYFNLGFKHSAIKYHLTAVAYDIQLNRMASAQENYNRIAQLFFGLGEVEKAEMYVEKGLALHVESTAVSEGETALIQGDLQYAKGQYQEALDLYQQANQLLNEYTTHPSYLLSQFNIVSAYAALENYTKLISYYERFVENKPHLDSALVPGFYNIVGSAYSKLSPPNFKQAEKYCELGLVIAERQHSLTDLQEGYATLADVYQAKNKPDLALRYVLKSNELKDSMEVIANTKMFADLELQYRTAEKEQEIKMLAAAKNLADLETEKQREQRNAMIMGSGVLFLALGAAGVAYRKTKKYNQFLSQEEQRKEALLQEVHHRTNNSLQLISALLTMQSEQIEDEQAKGYLQQSESRIHSMSALHEMLHNNATGIEVNMADYLGNILDFHEGLAPENVNITANLTSRKMQAKTAMPLALITNELITNSLKYAFEDVAKGEIHVVLGETDTPGQWSLTVSDNGKGLPSNAFQEGVGNVGSRLISILTRQVRGELVVENQNGAKVSVIFKV